MLFLTKKLYFCRHYTLKNMIELFDFSFSLINIFPTTLLVLVIIYWITVLFGFLSVSSFDFDVDTDVDIDVDVDIDADVDTDVNSNLEIGLDAPNFFTKSILFLNIGKVPFMIFLSSLAIPLWFTTILTNYYLKIDSILIAFSLFIPLLIINLFFAKIITQPIAGMFKKIDEATGLPEVFTGKIGKARIELDEKSNGQIEIVRDGATAILTARSTKGKIEAGKSILIIDYIKEEKYYLVEQFDEI